jgi:hypothetical protein
MRGLLTVVKTLPSATLYDVNEVLTRGVSCLSVTTSASSATTTNSPHLGRWGCLVFAGRTVRRDWAKLGTDWGNKRDDAEASSGDVGHGERGVVGGGLLVVSAIDVVAERGLVGSSRQCPRGSAESI